MSQRRTVVAGDSRNVERNGASAVSVVSTASSSANLVPFEGLNQNEVAFIDSIIDRVPFSATTFVPVFKAYQDEFEARELNATDDQFYYNMLLKLGMIRAENWQERWRLVKEHFDYVLEESEKSEDVPIAEVPLPRNSRYLQAYDDEDDAFTLHSHEESAGYAAPPSYTSKRRRNLDHPLQGSSSAVKWSKTPLPTEASANSARHGLATFKTHSTSEGTLPDVNNSPPPTAVPPSYHTFPHVATHSRDKSIKAPVPARDDAETWRLIEMERDADLFRRDSLLSRCFDVWVQGLHWVETTTTRLDNARTEFILRSVVTRWREKSATSIQATKCAAAMDRIRILNSSLSRWRLHAWTIRRKRWADEMRGRMIGMQNTIAKRQLAEAFSQWRKSHNYRVAARQCDLSLARRALGKWNQAFHQVAELGHLGDQLANHNDALLTERALETWKRQVRVKAAIRILRERQADRIVWNTLQLWRQKSHVQSIACGFSEARILRNAVQAWMKRRAKLKHLERRAIAHQNKPLVRAIFRIWIVKLRQEQYRKEVESRVLANALKTWKTRIQQHRQMEQSALTLWTKLDQSLLRDHLRSWAEQLASRHRLQRRAQCAYEMTVKAKALLQWKSKMWAHSKAIKEAKLVHKLFLQRMAWRIWTAALEKRSRDHKLEALVTKQLGRIFSQWMIKTKSRRALRRKEEVVLMTVHKRILRDTLQRWTLRVVFLKDREYCILQERREKLVRHYYLQWKSAVNQQFENTSLMLSFRDVRREENLRQILSHWSHAARRKRSLAEREEEFNKTFLSQAFERWRDRFLQNNLRPVELDVLLQSQTNLIFKMFRVWEAKTPSIPAIRLHAQHTRTSAWRKWRAAMPGAMKRKEAREHDHRILLMKTLLKWREKYQSKISMKAMARARYLRLPPASSRPVTSRLLLTKPKLGPRSYRSSQDEDDVRRPVSATIGPPEIGRAPDDVEATSTRGSYQGLGSLVRRRPTLTGPLSSDGGRWDGYGATRARARAAFSAARPASSYQPSQQDGESDRS